MNEFEQIAEMAKIIHGYCRATCPQNGCPGCWEYDKAEALYNTGYRQISDVIAEFKELVRQDLMDKGLFILAARNALDKAEKQMLGETNEK